MDPDLIKKQTLVSDSEAEPGPPAVSSESIYEGHRVDYETIIGLVEPGTRVLDIGCGDGELLNQLIVQKDVKGMGLELAQGNVVTCARRGISVIQADIDKGLESLPDQSFDYVLLSMTLQVVENPELVIREMLRVGKKVIISFPNFGFWKVRTATLLTGRAPVTRNLPYAWHQTPNRVVLTIKDFRAFCQQLSIRIEQELPLYSEGITNFWPNFFAEEAVYVLSAGK
jgi:methionine biosynthesis protein MetW